MSKQNLEGGTMLDVIQKTFKIKTSTVTLADALTLTAKDPPLQFLDPGGSGRTITLPAEADSVGLLFLMVNTADASEDLTVQDDASGAVATISQNESAFLTCDGTTWKGMVATTSATLTAANTAITDAGGFTSETNVEAALQEIYQDLLSVQSFIPISLMTFREATNFDVDNIAANGGILASDTTPVLDAINAATDGCQRLLWANTNNDQVITQIPLPPDLDVTKDIVLHFRIVSGSTTDAVGFTVASFFNEGDTSVADTSGTNQTATWAEVVATIAAADIPAGAQTLTIGLTPVAHTTDTMAMSACWIEYGRAILGS
jgi:hypothetical protein